MGLKSIDDIEDQIEEEIMRRAEERYKDENDREYVLVMSAKDSIAADMAEGLLNDNDIEVIKKSDSAHGIFGVTMFPPSLYVPAEDFERAFDILSECGFFDETEEAGEADGNGGENNGGKNGEGPPEGAPENSEKPPEDGRN